MAIAYTVKGALAATSSCYGQINSHLAQGTKPFTGIKLWLGGENTPEVNHSEGLLLNRHDVNDEYIKKMMRIARATGFGAYIPRTLAKLKWDGGINFDASVPFYVVVAVTGFFRAFNNHPTLIECYDMLVSKGLDPHTALAGAYTLDYKNGKYNLYLHGEHSIIPWTMFNEDSVALFKDWSSHVPSLPSMGDEYEETGTLTYAGRDEFFGATRSGNEYYFDEEDYKDEIPICVTLAHLESDTYEEYEPHWVDIDSLVEEVKAWGTKK